LVNNANIGGVRRKKCFGRKRRAAGGIGEMWDLALVPGGGGGSTKALRCGGQGTAGWLMMNRSGNLLKGKDMSFETEKKLRSVSVGGRLVREERDAGG